MFDQISATYDRANRAMTLWCDLYWRKKIARFLPEQQKMHILDGATGTGDQILSLFSHSDQIASAIGIDLSKDMLTIAKTKIAKKGLSSQVNLQEASLLALPFPAQTFDCVTISFGIRNVTDVALALHECYRVLKKGGRLLILEGSIPENRWLRSLSLFYLRHLLPRIGGFVAKNKEPYRYLNETIETFPSGKQFCALLERAGFSHSAAHSLMGGIATIYSGDKDALYRD